MAKRGTELIERGFYRFVREERHFCTILVQLLLAKNGNLGAFLKLANTKLDGAPLTTRGARRAEIYTEFSMLRDDWNAKDEATEATKKLVARPPGAPLAAPPEA